MEPSAPRGPNTLLVLLADDHAEFREGVRVFLEAEPDIQVVAEADGGLVAIRLAREFGPHVVVMDVGMPDVNGIEATSQIRSSLPTVKVVALSMHGEPSFVQAMLAAGASGYVLKENALTGLPGAIRAVAGGGTYLCPQLR
jgi:LuxR family maltose regulon positive regulatory protein